MTETWMMNGKQIDVYIEKVRCPKCKSCVTFHMTERKNGPDEIDFVQCDDCDYELKENELL